MTQTSEACRCYYSDSRVVCSRCAIHKVTDLRTGLEHPTRDSKGRFLSPERARNEIHMIDRILHDRDARRSKLVLGYAVRDGMIALTFGDQITHRA